MEKKTLGAFIAVLRKANGMTQAELAEKLHVSDKAVSRWERDVTVPDLTLIPVLAEIFGVTADELLRGERLNTEKVSEEHAAVQAEKRRQWLMRRSYTKFFTRSMLPIGLGAVGLIGAMIANFGFQRAYVGFFIACIFYVVAILCQSVFTSLALTAVGDEDTDEKALFAYRWTVIGITERCMIAVAILFAATLPLIVLPWDPYLGLEGFTWLTYGALFGVIAAVVCGILVFVLNLHLPSATDDTRTAQKRAFRRVLPLVCVLLITLFGQLVFNSMTTASDFTAGTTFDNWADFKEFMETPSDFEESYGGYGTESVVDDNGTVLCKYDCRRSDVILWKWGGSADMLPVTVYTSQDLASGNEVQTMINGAWIALYVVEIAVGYALYRRKKRRICI